MCLRSRGRAEFRRRKSLPPPSAEFWSAHWLASRIWFAPAGKVAAAWLKGLATGHNPGGVIDHQSCFLTAVVDSRLVSLSVFR